MVVAVAAVAVTVTAVVDVHFTVTVTVTDTTMGNQTSSETGDVTSTTVRLPNIKHFLRQSGALGLSKSELDERCKPSG